MRDALDDLRLAIEHETCRVIAIRFNLENERRSNMSRLSEKLAAAAAVAPRQAAKIEARADTIIAREQDIERQTEQSFLPHELLLDEAENGLSALEKELRLMSNNPPLEHSTPLPAATGAVIAPVTSDPLKPSAFSIEAEKLITPTVSDPWNAFGKLDSQGNRVALGPHPDQPEVEQAGIQTFRAAE